MNLFPSSEAFARVMMRHKFAVLAIILAITALFAWKAVGVRFKNPTIELFPQNHPYVQTYVQYEEVFGGANVVVMSLRVKEGDIYNEKTLAKIQRITKALELVPNVNNYQVLSLAQRKVKKTVVDEVEGYKSDPIMWPEIPTTPEGIADLKRTVYTSGRVRGGLVSLDDKATLILAGFFEKGVESPGDTLRQIVKQRAAAEGADAAERLGAFERVAKGQAWTLDDTLFSAVMKIAKAEVDRNTTVHVIGRPILLGWVYTQLPSLLTIFLLTIAAMVLVLVIYFRGALGVGIPVVTAALSAAWGIGFVGLLGHHFNPLLLVVPFIISARALSHSVQLIERFDEEYATHKDREKAAVATFAGVFKPGMLSILTDAAGIYVVAVTPIPLMEKLAVMGGFWLLSIIVADLIFNPLILSMLPPPRLAKGGGKIIDRILEWVHRTTLGWRRWAVLGVTAVVFVVGFGMASKVVIGDAQPGTPILWPSSEYNKDTAVIADAFGNTEILSVVVEGKDKNAIKTPEVLVAMERLQRKLEAMPEVSGTSSISDLVPEISKIMHGGDPKWELIPMDRRESGFYMEMIFSGAEPGDLARFITNDAKDANLTVYLKDHKGTTLRAVIAAIKEFMTQNPLKDAQMRLAGNFGGLLAAVNEAIVVSEARVTIIAFSITFLLCALAFKSLFAGVFFLIPIGISNFLTYALMGALGIGLDVNSLPVVALGVGLGVDYGLYIVGRMEEDMRRGVGLQDAAHAGILTAGRAVLFTASTMVVGIVFWTFSLLRFKAEMGILLSFWMVMSALGGLILLPVLAVIIKPKFLMRNVKPATEK